MPYDTPEVSRHLQKRTPIINLYVFAHALTVSLANLRGYPQAVSIVARVVECPGVVTLRFRFPRNAEPGQFLMVWVPGVDEVPMSVSYAEDPLGITVKKVGECTSALCALREGQKIGIRGPLGHGYRIGNEKILFVAGGIGIASLAPAVEKAREPTVVLGFRVWRRSCSSQRTAARDEMVLQRKQPKICLPKKRSILWSRAVQSQ
jgi:ferredoxin-NADP reductase